MPKEKKKIAEEEASGPYIVDLKLLEELNSEEQERSIVENYLKQEFNLNIDKKGIKFVYKVPS